jgi:hypothetical protein
MQGHPCPRSSPIPTGQVNWPVKAMMTFDVGIFFQWALGIAISGLGGVC